METLFWIESAGFNQHINAAYPSANNILEADKVEKKARGKSYYRLFEDLMVIPSTSKQSVGPEPTYQSLPVRIENCDLFLNGGKQFINFNIYMGGFKITSRAYAEFENLHSCLRNGYRHIGRLLPQLPQTYAHLCSLEEIENYRQDLEKYLFEVCRIKNVAESESVQDFLGPSIRFETAETNVEECIKLSDRVFLHLPVGYTGDKTDLKIGGDLDYIESVRIFSNAGSSRSFLAM